MAAYRPSTPVVCTLTTAEVERISQRNGLSFHELLSAFSSCQLRTHFRSITSHYPLNELTVRFIRASELRPRTIMRSEELMRTSYVTLGDEHEEELMRKPCVAKDATSMPWYDGKERLPHTPIRSPPPPLQTKLPS